MHRTLTHLLVSVIGSFVLGGCAGQTPTAPYEIGSGAESCPKGDSLICVEKLGETTSCHCGDDESLRQILEPRRMPR